MVEVCFTLCPSDKIFGHVLPSRGYQGASKTLNTATREAKEHLDSYWLVGVIEQYGGFMAVLQAMMDPLKKWVVGCLLSLL